jgi:hypothetical protein
MNTNYHRIWCFREMRIILNNSKNITKVENVTKIISILQAKKSNDFKTKIQIRCVLKMLVRDNPAMKHAKTNLVYLVKSRRK